MLSEVSYGAFSIPVNGEKTRVSHAFVKKIYGSKHEATREICSLLLWNAVLASCIEIYILYYSLHMHAKPSFVHRVQAAKIANSRIKA